MYQLLIFASLALVAQAQTTAPAPEVTTLPTLSAAQIQQHLLMGWALPEPGAGPRATRAAQSQPESTTAPPELNAEQIQQQLAIGWALPEPGAGTRLARAAPPLSPPLQQHTRVGPRATRAAQTHPESTTAPPELSAQIQQLPRRWADRRQMRAAPALRPAEIRQHTRWASPEPGVVRPIRAAPRAPPAHNAHGPRSPPLQGHRGMRAPGIRAPLH